MSRKDFSQQFPSHRDFSHQFPSHRDFSQQFSSEHDFSQQFPGNEPVNTPPEVIFPVFQQQLEQPVNNPPANFPAQNQPNARALTDEELYEQDMQEVLRVEAEEERERRAREDYLRAKQDRRNRRCACRIANGIHRVPTSDDDSSASSHEGYVSDDSFY